MNAYMQTLYHIRETEPAVRTLCQVEELNPGRQVSLQVYNKPNTRRWCNPSIHATNNTSFVRVLDIFPPSRNIKSI